MPQQNKRPNLIRDTRIATQSRLKRALQDRPLHHVPVLFLKGLPRSARNLSAELDCIARVWVRRIRARVLAFEERRVQDVRAGVLEGRKRGWLGGDPCKDVERVGQLEGALLVEFMRGVA